MTRYTPNLYKVHIADGFADDCDELIHRCTQAEVVTYPLFCEVWKDMNMGSLYHGRSSGAEIAELSEEVLHIAKHYMFTDTSNFEETVTAVFLVYALLNLQPFEGFAALRLVPEDVPAIARVEAVARRERRLDVLYALASVLVRGPCQYHAAQRERGLETPVRKYFEGCTSITRLGVRPKGVFFRQNEEMDVLRELTGLSKKYEEAKTALTDSADRNLAYTDPELPKQLETSMKQVINGLLDEEPDDEDEKEGGYNHFRSVQAIKARAMKQQVTGVRHLTGVDDRICNEETELSPNTKVASKYSPPKICSPTPPKRRRRIKRPRKNSNPEKVINNDNETIDIEDDNDKPIDLRIDKLPSVVDAEADGKRIEIEFIDEMIGKDKTDIVDKLSHLPDLSITKVVVAEEHVAVEDTLSKVSNISVADSDDLIFKKPRNVLKKKELKRPIIKSKFKKLGLLPMVDLEVNRK